MIVKSIININLEFVASTSQFFIEKVFLPKKKCLRCEFLNMKVKSDL